MAASNGKTPFLRHSSDDIWLQVVRTRKNERHSRLQAQRMSASEIQCIPMTRTFHHRTDPGHARDRARRCTPIVVMALLVVMAPASAMQQANGAQDPVLAEAATTGPNPMQPATRGIAAQAANEAAAARLEPAPQPGQDKQGAQDTVQQASAESVNDVPMPEAQASEALPAAWPDVAAAAPRALGTTRGVLFRIFPPMPTTLPAELAVAGPASVDDAAQATTEAATDPASSSAQPTAAPSTQPEPLQPSYLLGTIHFGTPEEQGVDYSVLEKALADVDTFVNEANLDEAWKPAYDDYRWLSSSQPLSTMVSKDSYAMARSLLPNVRMQDLVRMKPWSVLALLEARGETAGDATMDARLQRIAAASGKRLVHLETLEQQLQALDCVPASEHALVLDERLRAPWILRDESAAAMGYYRSRNLDAWLADIDHMYGLSYAGKAVEQRARHCLLEERNARWAGQLETLFQDGPSFVAVGAVHLVGADGLLAVLRRDGYRIEEVPL